MTKVTKLLACASAVALFAGAAHAADLTVTSWGGAYTASQQKAYGEPWEKESGKKIHWENYTGGLGEIRAQVEAKNVIWDIVDLVPSDTITACDEGLLVELPDDLWVKTKDGKTMDEDMMIPRPNKCAGPQIFWSTVAFYDSKAFEGDKPGKLVDFFDLKKFPGKRGVYGRAASSLEMALVADGVAVGDVYKVLGTPEGVDRAFAKLDTIKGDSVFWTSGSKPLEFVKSGEVKMATAWNGRVGAAVLADGETFVTIWDGQVLDSEYLVIVKGTKNLDAAKAFMAFATAPAQQAGQAKYINYGPMRRSAFEIIQAGEPWFVKEGGNVAIMPHMPNHPDRLPNSVITDVAFWADNQEELDERYEAWKSK